MSAFLVMDSLVDAGFVILGGPLADEHRVALIPSHLRIDAVEPWTIRLDGRRH